MPTTNRAHLHFEHVGDLTVEKAIVVADPKFIMSGLAGMAEGGVALSRHLRVVAGQWHAMVVTDGPSETKPRFILICHEDELEIDEALTRSATPGPIRIDSGRLVLLDAALRDRPDIQDTLLATEFEDDALAIGIVADHGVVLDTGAEGIYEVYTSPVEPYSAVFVVLRDD